MIQESVYESFLLTIAALKEKYFRYFQDTDYHKISAPFEYSFWTDVISSDSEFVSFKLQDVQRAWGTYIGSNMIFHSHVDMSKTMP